MIQELDQEKQEAEERYERTRQQYRDDVVHRVREELMQEHTAHIEQLASQHLQHKQQLQSKLADLSQEVLAVQECYISVCKEKDKLEENLQNKLEEEKRLKEIEPTSGGRVSARSPVEDTHTQAEIELQVREQLEAEEQETLEKSWAQRLQEAEEEVRKARQSDTREGARQTGSSESAERLISAEDPEVRLRAQRESLQQEASSAQARAVEESVRHAERELQQKRSRARSRWLQDLPSLPEYKSCLQTEKDEWERLQQQHVQEQVFVVTDTSMTAKQSGIKPQGFEPDSLKSAVICGSKDPVTVGRVTQKHTHFQDSVFKSDVRTPNITLRKQSREMFMEGFESGRAEPSAGRSFLIEEAPVRDEGQSDWSPGKPFSVNGPSLGALDFGSSIGDNSDVKIYKEIVQAPSYSKPSVCVDRRTNKHREPIPGSEGDGVWKMRPKSLFSELKDQTYSYVQSDKQSNKIARSLLKHADLHEGDTVALLLGNEPMFLWICLALTKIGCSAALLNHNIRSKSLLHCFTCCEATVLIAGPVRQPLGYKEICDI
ncbi:centrosomal protein of 152 kDa [Pimephales promelas]|nr:centrosomal protein of 152 kDa [Pimephales promelas]